MANDRRQNVGRDQARARKDQRIDEYRRFAAVDALCIAGHNSSHRAQHNEMPQPKTQVRERAVPNRFPRDPWHNPVQRAQKGVGQKPIDRGGAFYHLPAPADNHGIPENGCQPANCSEVSVPATSVITRNASAAEKCHSTNRRSLNSVGEAETPADGSCGNSVMACLPLYQTVAAYQPLQFSIHAPRIGEIFDVVHEMPERIGFIFEQQRKQRHRRAVDAGENRR